jgi:hypothetical protein
MTTDSDESSIPARRRALRLIACGSALAVLPRSSLAWPAQSRKQSQARAAYAVSPADDAFLEDLSRRGFRYFWEQADAQTGLVLDRARTKGLPNIRVGGAPASIASTGFGLTALAIAAERGWVDAEEARARVLTTLEFFAERAVHERGWYYHFLDAVTGERQWNCEVSSIDSALLLAGVLTARQKFHDDSEVARLAAAIYNRIDFQWMLNGDPYLLAQGWKPETGFLDSRWDSYSELMILYLLAIGSPTYPIPPESWSAWSRPEISYAGYTYINCAPLFIHQYAHAWVDFRGLRDRMAPHYDYFLNSIMATRAHRAFCVSLWREFSDYSENVWGITASDSIRGYVFWGGPPRDRSLDVDGTLVPSAPGGSLMFTPDICLPALLTLRRKFGERIYGQYGFVDAFNPLLGWVDPDVIGLGLGITLLSAENLRSGNVWRWFMSNPEPSRALNLVLEPY